MSGTIKLTIVTPTGVAFSVTCDSVRLNTPDDRHGHGGGSIGIRRGHVSSVIAIAEGETVAFSNGAVVLRVRTKNGFASIENDEVQVITASADPPEAERGHRVG